MVLGWILNQLSYYLRRFTHWGRMRHIKQGRDWRFYKQYSIAEILKMKLDSTEEQKMDIWYKSKG